ncbi:CbiX/SirB N-terminal domain-containing protein [Granulosicoccaceae sp. 1_MG-2023]|nr:CbiX/SirB N-terminal domain-containing protein [Granulosicoccaceae sp. 1_MG-2023]
MKALLLVAHGSRRAASNEEVQRLATAVEQQLDGACPIVTTAFLELADPLIPEAIDRCVARGASEIIVLPYFLAAGRHVAEDIPRIAEQAVAAHPGVRLTLAPHLGASVLMSGFLAASAQAAINGDSR